MVQLELEVVVIGLGSEADFLDDDLSGLGFLFLQALFLVKDELLVVHGLTNRRVGIGLDLNKVDTQFLYDSQGLTQWVDVRFYTFTHQTHHRSFHLLIDAMVKTVLIFVRLLTGCPC